MKVVFMSGYPTRGDLKAVSLPDDVCFLQKPFTPVQLARAIQRALEGRAALPGEAA